MFVYKVTCLINNKIYVGQQTKNNDRYFGSGTKIKNAIKKYGLVNFIKEILVKCSNQQQLDYFEAYYIKKYNSTDKDIGYNILSGTSNKFGSGSPMNIKEVRIKAKRAINNFYKTKESIDTRRKMSEIAINRFSDKSKRLFGSKNSMFGKKHSEEMRLRISNSVKKTLSNPDIRKVISEKSKQFWQRLEKDGQKDELISKRSENKKRSVLMFDLHDKFLKKFKSAKDIEDELGYCRMNIGTCCRKNKDNFIHKRYGYKWKYE